MLTQKRFLDETEQLELKTEENIRIILLETKETKEPIKEIN